MTHMIGVEYNFTTLIKLHTPSMSYKHPNKHIAEF